MSYWEKNVSLLCEKDEKLYQEILKYHENWVEEESGYGIEQARDGSDILVLCQDGKKVAFNSTYRPLEEAAKYVKKIQLTDNSILVFFGLGNGILLSQILDKLNEESLLILSEPSPSLFCYVLEHFALEEVLKDKRIALFVEGMNEEIMGNNLSFALNTTNVGVTTLETHPKYKELYPEEYEKTRKVFKECRESALTNLNTIITRSQLMTKNAIQNLYYYLRSKVATDLVNRFPEDMPAILVAGGPSLDKNYEVLKQAKGKALIIAVDRTAKYLLDRGIEPDMFCSLDFAKNPELFRDERLKDIPFLYMPDLSRQVMDIVDGNRLIYGTGDFKLYDWLANQFDKKNMELPVGGSVATFGFGFARHMGIKRLILVGQDLALTGGKTYSGGQVNRRAEAEEFEHVMVPGNVEEMVETRGDFYVYLIWFQQAVQEAKDMMEVINATEGGARIEGTQIMTLQEAVDTYCQKEYDVRGIFDAQDYIIPEGRRTEAYELLVAKRQEIAKLKKKAKNASESARRCSVLTERKDFGKEFKKQNKELSAIGEVFDKDVAASLVNKYTEGLMLEQDMDLYVTEEEETKEMLRLYHKLEYDYKQVHDNIDELLEQYDTMLERCRKELGIDEE